MTLLPPSITSAYRLKCGHPDPLTGCIPFGDIKTHIPVQLSNDLCFILANNEGHYTGPGTNTYLVGQDRLWIIDPGPASTAHLNAVIKAVDGRPVDGILVTHSQVDHSPASAPLADMLDCITYGFGPLDPAFWGLQDEGVDPAFKPNRTLTDGQVLDNGHTLLQAIHTPGHYPNHMAFYWPKARATFSGDHILGWATTVVVPPLGDLGDYLKSLAKLGALGAQTLYPSHGPAIEDPRQRCLDLAAHRLTRHRQIISVLEKGCQDPNDIAAQVYPAMPEKLKRAAIGQVRSHLAAKAVLMPLCEKLIATLETDLKKSA